MADGVPGLIRVNRIQRFCIQDGPGLRTTVFLQGCTLRCWWCHNPDTRCAYHPNEQAWRVSDLLDLVGRDERYWRRSGGGVTLSGGEPLMQIDAACAFLEGAGERGWHRVVETAAAVPLAHIQRAVPHVDHWLYDVKSVDPDAFRAGTQGDARRVLDNLRWLLGETPARVTVRIPLINGFNADHASMAAIADQLLAMPRAADITLLPGHEVGTCPAEWPISPRVSTEVAETARAELLAAGLSASITW